MKTLDDALAAIEDMKAAHEAEKTAILNKNKELVAREKAAKNAADEAEAAREEAANEAASKSGDIETIKASLIKKHDAELKKLTDQLSKATGELSTLKIDNTISDAITANGVLPHHADILRSYLRSNAELRDGEAYAGDKLLTDHIAEFFSSESAKHYVAAPLNSGAGAQGSSTSATNNHGYTRENFSQREGEWLILAKNNPAEAKAIAQSVGRNDLGNTL